MSFCKFRDPRAGTDIFVNPRSVRAIRKSEFSAGASLVFEDGSAVLVEGDIDEIVKRLEEAMTA